ncbi:MAG: enoyl-CoA hydratase/isomerase family protein [Microthrixaceae bacterium]
MSLLDITDADGVRLLTWNRPDALNALNDELWDATRDGLVGAQADPELRCVVLTGTGRAFTAGQDLTEMMAPPDHGDEQLHGYRGLIPVLEAFDKPLLAAVNGLALGIGATLLPYCDIVWIAQGARLKVPFVTLGVTTEAAGSLLLPQRMGWQAAARFIFTAEWMSAEEAVACGLAWQVSPEDQLVDDAMAVARQIGAMPVDALQTTKRLMVASRLDAVRAARGREDAEFVRMVGSEANREALAKFFS